MFLILKSNLKCWNPKLWTKKHWGFFIMFSIVQFHLEIVSANMTLTNQSTIICLKHIYIYIYGRQCNVISVENILKRNKNHGTLAKMQFNFLVIFFFFQKLFTGLNKSTWSKNADFRFVFLHSILGIGTNTCATSTTYFIKGCWYESFVYTYL